MVPYQTHVLKIYFDNFHIELISFVTFHIYFKHSQTLFEEGGLWDLANCQRELYCKKGKEFLSAVISFPCMVEINYCFYIPNQVSGERGIPG